MYQFWTETKMALYSFPSCREGVVRPKVAFGRLVLGFECLVLVLGLQFFLFWCSVCSVLDFLDTHLHLLHEIGSGGGRFWVWVLGFGF